MASGGNFYAPTIDGRKTMNSKKKFWFSLVCDYSYDEQDGDVEFVLSKAKLMCWISFIGLLVLALFPFFKLGLDDKTLQTIQAILPTSQGILQGIFTTSFIYEGFKRGASAYENVQSTKAAEKE